MKYKLFALSIALILPVLSMDSRYVYAPELFGEGKMYAIGGLGYIAAWGGWIIYNGSKTCVIVQVSGERIDGADKPIPCFTRQKNGDGRFVGWIDFRGHRRKFCGAGDPLNLPRKCYGE